MLRLKGYVLFLCFFLALSVSVILGSINFVHAINFRSHNPNLPKLNTSENFVIICYFKPYANN